MLSGLFSDKKQQPSECSIITIPYVPQFINLEDLDDRCMLLPEEEISRLRQLSLQRSFNRKSDTGCKYDILAENDELFAAYWGHNHGIQVPHGAFSKVKYAQNLATGEWIVRKMTGLASNTIPDNVIKEADTLDEIDMSVMTKNTSHGIRLFRHSPSKNATIAEVLMKNAPGITLTGLMYNTNNFSHFVKFQLAISLIEKLISLHQRNVSQDDLNTGNIIYDPSKRSFTIIDFGFSNELSEINAPYDRKSMVSHVADLFSDDSVEISCLLEKTHRTLESDIIDDNIQNKSLAVLNEFLFFLIDERNKIPDNERIFKIGVLDTASNIGLLKNQLTTYPIIILKDNSTSHTSTSFLKLKHTLEQNDILVLDRAISNASANTQQFHNHLYQLMHEYNPECHGQFYDVATGKLLTECEPATEMEYVEKDRSLPDSNRC